LKQPGGAPKHFLFFGGRFKKSYLDPHCIAGHPIYPASIKQKLGRFSAKMVKIKIVIIKYDKFAIFSDKVDCSGERLKFH
jgi:hypothetical protein